jgi:hypothetical protein
MPLRTVFISGIPEPTAFTETKLVNPTANEIRTNGKVTHIRYWNTTISVKFWNNQICAKQKSDKSSSGSRIW